MLKLSHRKESGRMLATLTEERSTMLDKLLELHSQTLATAAYDYSYWDDMLNFVRASEPTWAKVNIEDSLPSLNAHAAWVLDANGALVYGITRQLDEHLRTPPLPMSDLLARLKAQKFLHFFFRDGFHYIEVHAAPIQPSSDTQRTTTPVGWLLFGRIWDEKHLSWLSDTLHCSILLTQANEAERHRVENPAATLHVHHDLPDYQGRALAVLHAWTQPPALRLLQEENYDEMLLFGGFSFLASVLLIFGITRWVVTPLRSIEASLAGNSTTPLHPLWDRLDEFGRIAHMIGNFFGQKESLRREVDERIRAEAALRESEKEIRTAAELNKRLGRDLHDSVIQSIYAAGLGLEGAMQQLEKDPGTARQRITAARDCLNQTIVNVRSFITGAEPDNDRKLTFPESLRVLISALRSLNSTPIALLLPDTPPALSSTEEIHALQIVREGISNAVRHGDAVSIIVSYELAHGRRQLTITDDGCGFEPSNIQLGHGLANFRTRANEINGELLIESKPGKGTRLILLFSPGHTG